MIAEVYTIRQRVRREEEASGLVEISLTLAIVFTLIFAVIDVSRALYTDHYVAFAARQAARYAMVRGSTWAPTACATPAMYNCAATSSDVQSYVQSLVPPVVNPGYVAVATTWPGTSPSGGSCLTITGRNTPGCEVAVTVTYNFNFLWPFLPSKLLPLTSSAAVVVVQ